ncbi:MAG: hypothetical protein LBU27_00305 [Candidatus Peribacteria bacterium]|jgi:hypothetical protein|nr:hypothetical protein [Candidatus Peribacteria bacterium]
MNATKTFKEKLPSNIFECFRISLTINTDNKNPTDEDVEKYISALVDTSDKEHAYAGQTINTHQTFRPAT